MATFDKFVVRMTPQTAVYWGNPVNDGFGGYTFDDPVEINVRWDEKSEMIRDLDGNEIVSKAQVMVRADVDIRGMLFLGTLEDLDSTQEVDPNTIETAYQIISFDKIPMPRSTDVFFRQSFL